MPWAARRRVMSEAGSATERSSRQAGMKREVTNEELKAALENSDNHNLMRSEARKYEKTLDEEEIERACLRAMWRCLGNHIPDHASKQKFTTSLYRFLKWELNRAVAAQKKARKGLARRDVHDIPERALKPTKTNRRTNSPQTEAMAGFVLEQARKCLHDDDLKILQLYFLGGMTAEEVGSKVGKKKEQVRSRVEFIVKYLRTRVEKFPFGTPGQRKYDPHRQKCA
jgi:RNA polymerase sigma factor (sigma-70 family)